MKKSILPRLAGLAVLLGVLLLLAAGGYYLVFGTFDLPARILLGAGAALIVYAALDRPDSVEKAFSARGMRYGSNAVIFSLAAIGILVIINFVAANRAERWDWTANQQYTLSEQTLNILSRLEEPVHAYLFFEGGNPMRQSAEDLIKEYTVRTDKLTYEVVDPDLNPGLAAQLGIRSYGTTVFVQGEKRQETTSISEVAFTSALLRVENPTQRKVYFITGHEEADITQATRDGSSGLREILERDNYVVEPLTVAISGTIPSDASAIVIAGARRPLLDQERDAIAQYLENGGRAVIMREPRTDIGLEDLLRSWGVDIRDGVAIDPLSSLQGDPIALAILRYSGHPIVQPLRALTILPFMSWVGRAETVPEGTTVTELLSTSEAGWLETDQERIELTEGADSAGPVPVAVAVERRPSGGATSRIVVFGGSTWVQNQLLALAQAQNIDLFANAVNWVTESEELLSIRPKDQTPETITLTAVQANFVLVSSIIFLPLIVLLAGGFVWWRRR